jgi:site-specific DNA-methyltransferase (adenine-specific)
VVFSAEKTLVLIPASRPPRGRQGFLAKARAAAIDTMNNMNVARAHTEIPADNKEGALERLLSLNEYYRTNPWPAPFNRTGHRLHRGDARDLAWLANKSVHLVVTSPPYWTLKQYEPHRAQLGDIDSYELFLAELDKVWIECERILVPGGRICCVVGDVCVPRKRHGRHYVMPLHADIQVRVRRMGLDCLTPILWQKIANGATEVAGNGAGFYGKPYQPGAIIKNDVEYILFFRKGGEYRSPTALQKTLSMLSRQEMRAWLRSSWTDLRGASTRGGHPAPFPAALAERLIRMFSFAGDTVFDPFVGTGSTSVAALECGRNSIGCDIEGKYLKIAETRLRGAACQARLLGTVQAEVTVD